MGKEVFVVVVVIMGNLNVHCFDAGHQASILHKTIQYQKTNKIIKKTSLLFRKLRQKQQTIRDMVTITLESCFNQKNQAIILCQDEMEAFMNEYNIQ